MAKSKVSSRWAIAMASARAQVDVLAEQLKVAKRLYSAARQAAGYKQKPRMKTAMKATIKRSDHLKTLKGKKK